MRRPTVAAAGVALVLSVFGARALRGRGPAGSLSAVPSAVVPRPTTPMPAPGTLGGPRTDLSAEALAAFERGRALFSQTYDLSTGLGPYFNGASCAGCHDQPTLGGMGSADDYVVTGRSPGSVEDIENFQRFAIPGFRPRAVPALTSRLLPPSLFGVGLIEAIPDAYLRAQGCGPGGTQHVIRGRVARFGTKPFAATVRGFVASAMYDEIGGTNTVLDDGPDAARDADGVRDPEISDAVIRDLTAYAAGLAPPPTLPADPRGQAVFHELGCDTCHRPWTGPGVRAWTDLCLHSMGPTLADGIISHATERVPLSIPYDGDEFRTRPLWGLRTRALLLHDGRARTPDEAIRLHGGDAATSAARYAGASETDRATLLAFLATL